MSAMEDLRVQNFDVPPHPKVKGLPGATLCPTDSASVPFGWPEFFSRFAHEFRTPLQVVLGYSELLGEEDLTPEQKEAVEAIQCAGRHLLALVADSLDLGLSESRNRVLRFEAIECSGLLADVVLQIRPLCAGKSITVAVGEAPSNPVLADRRRLVQVLLNLLSNAVKFTPDGGSIELLCSASDGEHVRFEVRDSGPGIPTAGLARLFRPFERLAPEIPGAGLGLAICRSLVEEMGGTLGATSAVGLGSTFWFELPVASVEVVSAPRDTGMLVGQSKLCA